MWPHFMHNPRIVSSCSGSETSKVYRTGFTYELRIRSRCSRGPCVLRWHAISVSRFNVFLTLFHVRKCCRVELADTFRLHSEYVSRFASFRTHPWMFDITAPSTSSRSVYKYTVSFFIYVSGWCSRSSKRVIISVSPGIISEVCALARIQVMWQIASSWTCD